MSAYPCVVCYVDLAAKGSLTCPDCEGEITFLAPEEAAKEPKQKYLEGEDRRLDLDARGLYYEP